MTVSALFITKLIDFNLLFFAFILLRLIRTWHTHTHANTDCAVCLRCVLPILLSFLPLWESITMELLARRESKKRKLLPQAHSLLPFIVFNKASLLIQRGKREGKRRKLKKKKKREKKREWGGAANRKASQSSFEFHLIFLWELRGGKKKKINYGAHLNIISSTQPPTLCPSPRKPNYSANLSLAVAGLVLKKTIKQAWINLWQAPYL